MEEQNVENQGTEGLKNPLKTNGHRSGEPEFWPGPAGGPLLSVQTEPTGREKLRFAKQFLMAAGFIYCATAISLVIMSPEHIKDVWFTTALAITGLASGIAGYYFGKR